MEVTQNLRKQDDDRETTDLKTLTEKVITSVQEVAQKNQKNEKN